MKYFFAVFLIILFGIQISCETSSKPLNKFFNKFEEKIKNNIAFSKFKNAQKDSILFYSQNFTEEFNELYKDSSYSKNIDKFLSKFEKSHDLETAENILIFAFHSSLNNNNSNLNQVADYFFEKNKREKNRINKEQQLLDDENLKIIQANNHKWETGDTLSIILPVRLDELTSNKSSYYSYGYPLTLDYSQADDTLKIKGILLNKSYESYSGLTSSDSMDLVFKLKITELSNTDYKILGKKYEVGNELRIPLRDYGRPID